MRIPTIFALLVALTFTLPAPAGASSAFSGLLEIIRSIDGLSNPDFATVGYIGEGSGTGYDGITYTVRLKAFIPKGAPLLTPEGGKSYVYTYTCSASTELYDSTGNRVAHTPYFSWWNSDGLTGYGQPIKFCGSTTREHTLQTTCHSVCRGVATSVSGTTMLEAALVEFLRLKVNQFPYVYD